MEGRGTGLASVPPAPVQACGLSCPSPPTALVPTASHRGADFVSGSGRCAGCWLREPGSPRRFPPSPWEDCRGNTVYVVSSANAGCNQCFNEVLEAKCRFNLLIALRGRQIALYRFLLSCKLIKEYRGAFE